MTSLTIKSLDVFYGQEQAIHSLNLFVDDGNFAVLLGPSGCGKTTTLRAIAGLIGTSKGSLTLGEREISNLDVHKRGIGVVFQNFALFPHMTVSQNITFGMKQKSFAKEKIQRNLANLLELTQISPLKNRYPGELSGGQKQRVAIARALAIEPDLLLLDEPLSSLDAKLRVRVRREIRALQQHLGITTIMVTHDQEEAMSLADLLVVMDDGVIQQSGSPEEVYDFPNNKFVADFVGAANILKGQPSSEVGKFKTESGVVLTSSKPINPTVNAVLIRPEDVTLYECNDNSQGDNLINSKIVDVNYLGGILELSLSFESIENFRIRVKKSSIEDKRNQLTIGGNLKICIPNWAVKPIKK